MLDPLPFLTLASSYAKVHLNPITLLLSVVTLQHGKTTIFRKWS